MYSRQKALQTPESRFQPFRGVEGRKVHFVPRPVAEDEGVYRARTNWIGERRAGSPPALHRLLLPLVRSGPERDAAIKRHQVQDNVKALPVCVGPGNANRPPLALLVLS